MTTLFLEGTPYERGELDPDAPKRPVPSLEAHPLVRHYGLSVEHLALTKAHRSVEGEHRKSAWRILTKHVAPDQQPAVLAAMEDALRYWQAYRDNVAQVCGLTPPENTPN